MAAIPQARTESGVHNRIAAAFFRKSDVVIGERQGPLAVPEALESMLPCALWKCASSLAFQPSLSLVPISGLSLSLSLLSTYIICTTHTHSIFRIIVYCTYSLCFQIVQRTIEMLISEQPMSSNVICNGYDKASFLSFFTYYCA